MSQKFFQIIRPVHVHLKTDKVDLKKKSHREKKKKCIFFQSTHQVDLKNGVKCYKDFFGYFNALKTKCDSIRSMFRVLGIYNFGSNLGARIFCKKEPWLQKMINTKNGHDK